MKATVQYRIRAAKLTFTRRAQNKETERQYQKEKRTGNKLLIKTKKTQNRYTDVRSCVFIRGTATDRHPTASLQKEKTRIKHWITTVSSRYNMETSYKVALRCWTLSGLSNQKRKKRTNIGN